MGRIVKRLDLARANARIYQGSALDDQDARAEAEIARRQMLSRPRLEQPGEWARRRAALYWALLFLGLGLLIAVSAWIGAE